MLPLLGLHSKQKLLSHVGKQGGAVEVGTGGEGPVRPTMYNGIAVPPSSFPGAYPD